MPFNRVLGRAGSTWLGGAGVKGVGGFVQLKSQE